MRPFPHRRGGHCASACLRDLLEYHSLAYGRAPVDESAVFGFSGALGFNYVEAEAFDPPVLVGRTADLEEGLCRHLGVALDQRATDDPREGWAWLSEEVDAGRPTMVYADIKELDYLDVRLHNSHHDIVVVDIDSQARRALVADHDRPRLEPCSLDSLGRARASTGFPGPARHRTWVMGFPDRLPDMEAAATAAVRQAVDNMVDPRLAAPVDGVFSGLDGVARFAEAFPSWPRRFPNLRLALKRLYVHVIRAGTGGALFRSFQASFLAEMARLLDARPLANAASIYERLARAWAEAAGGARGDDPAGRHARLVPLVDRIAELEHAGVAAMREWLVPRPQETARTVAAEAR